MTNRLITICTIFAGFAQLSLACVTPNFTASGVCDGNTVQFNDASTTSAGVIDAWTWDFGDSGNSTLQNPTHLYSGPGAYTVKLVVETDGGCKDSIEIPVNVWPNPKPSFSASDVCLGDSMKFTDGSTLSSGSIASWLWLFGDSQTDSSQSPVHAYDSYGDYDVVLVVESDSGCIDLTSKKMSVFDSPVAQFGVSNTCLLQPVSFTNTSMIDTGTIDQYKWDFGDSVPDSTSTDSLPTHIYSTPGKFMIELVVISDENCTDTILDSIDVFAAPTPLFSSDPVCLNDTTMLVDSSSVVGDTIVSWFWDFKDGNTDTLQNPVHIYDTAGDFLVQLKVITTTGCSDSIVDTVEVNPPPTVVYSNLPACEGLPTSFIDSSSITKGTIDQWLWTIGGTMYTDTNPQHIFATAGAYNVKLVATSDFGCVDSTLSSVLVNFVPNVSLTSNTSGCVPLDVQFTDLSSVINDTIASWEWTFGDSTSSSGESPLHTYTVDGSYDVTLKVTSGKGCVDTLILDTLITVHPLPVAGFSFVPEKTDILNPLVEFTDESTRGVTYKWNYGNGDSTVVHEPIYTYQDTGIFQVRQIVFSGFNCSDTAYKNVTILPKFQFYIPDVFSPNEDLVNDVFIAKGDGITDYEMWLFNRSGHLLHYSHGNTYDEVVPWDGKDNDGASTGKFLSEGVYAYLIKVIDTFGEPHQYVGTVRLVK